MGQGVDGCWSAWAWPRAILAALAIVLLAGCAGTPVAALSTSATPTASVATCIASACAAQHVTVFVEPDAGDAPVVHAIEGATKSVWVEVYLLTDRSIVRALETAAQRGVDVRVLLEPHPFGGGDVSAARTLEELNAAGAHAKASNPAFYYTHEKALVVDSATAYILTCNLTLSGLGGSSSAANRDYGIIDTDREDVAEISTIFLADWNHTTPALPDARLVVSPVNARTALTAVLTSAHTTLQVEDEEMYDAASETALIDAARRGVSVTLLLPAPETGGGIGASDLARLKQGGVQVRYLVAPYLHAKLIVADGETAFTGSENFSSTSLDQNRELGIILADTTALRTLTSVFSQDWALARPA